jgi:hypothetical protein
MNAMRGDVRIDRRSLIWQLIEVRLKLVKVAAAIPIEKRDDAFVGTWDVKDLLAHLIGWDYTNIDAVRDIVAGRLPSFYERYDPGWSTYNASLVRRHRTDDWDALLAALDRSQDSVGAILRCLPESEFERPRRLPGRARPLTIAGLVKSAITDEDEHRRQIESTLAGRRQSLPDVSV